MKIEYGKGVIKLDKELNALDKFTIDFASVLDQCGIKYVVVSGYVSILFGRSRSSEDIDIIIEKLNLDDFKKLWLELEKEFECIITQNPKKAYDEYLLTGHAIRFSRKKEYVPNMELKFPKVELEAWALENRKEVVVNSKKLFISPIELQISFKLFLGKGGNEKDIEDAKHLYEIFKDKLDMEILKEFNRKLKIEDLFNKYIQ